MAVIALTCLTFFSETVYAAKKTQTRVEKRTSISEDLTHPAFRTITVGSCPNDDGRGKEQWEGNSRNCSRAQLMYPYYKKYPWINRLIAQSVVLPMLAERLDEKQPVRGGGETLYKSKLISLVRKGGARGSIEKVPPIDFTAKLVGYSDEGSTLSPAGVPRPELFGPYLQFVFTHELSQRYDTQPQGPLGGFVVIDTRARKILTFDDLIVPGQEKALEDLQRAAFRGWLRRERNLPGEAIKAHFSDPSYAFRLNRNWRITEGGLVFRFATYEVGPRPFGSPEIFVKKNRLHDIIQSGILEQIPGDGLTAGN